jgi:FkbM family methyltransferase
LHPLKQLAATVSDVRKCGPRFAFAAIASKLSSGPVRIPLPGGGRATVRPRDSDVGTLRQVFRDQEYQVTSGAMQARIMARYDEICAAGGKPVIVDAGANIGAASLWFAQTFPRAAVVAIEPDPRSAEILRENLKGIPSAVALEAAIGSEPGHVAIIPSDQSWAVRTARSDRGCEIVTVEQAARKVPDCVLFIVKIDIEGFESDLFAANTGWMDEAFVIYVEPHDWMLPDQATSRSFQAEFGKRDFDILLRGENLIYVRRQH